MKRPSAVVLMLVVSLGLNVAQGRRVNDYRSRIAALKADGSLQVGTAMPALTGADTNGVPTSLPLAGGSQPILLYVFSPSCGWCTRNIDNIKALAAGAGDSFRLLGVSLRRKPWQHLGGAASLMRTVAQPLWSAAIRTNSAGQPPATAPEESQGTV